MISVLVGGVDKSSYVRKLGAKCSLSVRNRDTGSIQWKHGYLPGDGANVSLYDDAGNHIFAGTIDSRDLDPQNSHCTQFETNTPVIGWEQRWDKRIIRKRIYGGVVFALPDNDKLVMFGHNLSEDQTFKLVAESGGTVPGGLTAGTRYYAVNVTGDDFQVAASAGGSPIDITSVGTKLTFLQWLARDIIRHLNANEADSEGIVDSDNTKVEAGDYLDKLIFNYIPVSEAVEEVAKKCSKYWRIDAGKNLYFKANSSSAAPFNIDSTLAGTGSAAPVLILSVSRGIRADYRNEQFVQCKWEAVGYQEEDLALDANARTGVSAPVAEIVAIYQSDRLTPETLTFFTFAEEGTDAWADFYYSYGEKYLRYNLVDSEGNARSALGGTFHFSYKGLGDNVVAYTDSSEITARAAAEGGSGKYNNLFDDTQNGSPESVLDESTSLVAQYGRLTSKIRYRYYGSDVLPGMLQHVKLVDMGIDADYIVDQVDMTDAGDPDHVLFQSIVTLFSVSRQFDAVAWFKRLSRSNAGSGGGGAAGGGGGTSAGGGGGSSFIYVQTYTLSAASTNIVPATTADDGLLLILHINQDATGGRQITLDSSIVGLLPDMISIVENAKNIYTLAGKGDGKWYLCGVPVVGA